MIFLFIRSVVFCCSSWILSSPQYSVFSNLSGCFQSREPFSSSPVEWSGVLDLHQTILQRSRQKVKMFVYKIEKSTFCWNGKSVTGLMMRFLSSMTLVIVGTEHKHRISENCLVVNMSVRCSQMISGCQDECTGPFNLLKWALDTNPVVLEVRSLCPSPLSL